MIITKPEKILFETQDDIIDYIGRGLPPTKKNFCKLKDAISDVKFDQKLKENSTISETKVAGKDVIIPSHLVLNIDDETFNNILDRMYKNRVRTCKITLGVVCVAALALAIGGHKSSKSKDEDVEGFDIDIEEF